MTHLPVCSVVALVDEGFVTYIVSGDVLSGKMYDPVAYLVVACNSNTSVAADDHVMQKRSASNRYIFRKINVLEKLKIYSMFGIKL